MIHEDRTFCITEATSTEELATLLSGHTWSLCKGFDHDGHLFLNDSFNTTDPSVYAIIKVEEIDKGMVTGTQIDSFAFGGSDPLVALRRIEEGMKNGGNMRLPVKVKIEPDWHHSCELCRESLDL